MIPGYVLGAWLDVFSFRLRTLAARLAISVSLSIAVVPIVVYLTWRSLPTAPWLLCGAAWVAFPVLLVRTGIGKRGRMSRERVVVLAILAGWVAIGTLVLVDLPIGHRLYVPVTAYDYSLRTAITAAIGRTGVPPTNPYFFPGRGYTLRYHYFWYMLCGLVRRFGGSFLTARIAVISGTLWSGVGLVALVSLYTHCTRRAAAGNADRRMLVAVALLSVTGLDIVPLAITFAQSGRFAASSEWWNEPVLSWLNSVFWQPHSIAALVACATGFLVLWESSRHAERRVRFWGAAIGGVAFASGVGLSIYVTFVFGVFAAVWLVTLLFRGRRGEAALVVISGVIALGVSAPYLWELVGSGAGGGKMPIAFTVRSFYLAENFVEALGVTARWQLLLANGVSLPLNYFLEFGFFFLVGIRQWRRLRVQARWSDADVCGVAMLATSLVLCTFLRSTTIANNDLGWRGIIVAQFVLLLWAAEGWEKLRFNFAGVLLGLGVAATLYDVTMLRIYPVLLDDLAIPRYHWLAPDDKLGERTYALRQVYEALNRKLPVGAMVQQNPNASPDDLFYGLYADRQTVAETLTCGVVFGGDAALCPGVLAPIRELFDGSAGLEVGQVDVTCRKLSIAALVVKDTDGVWGDKESWVWKMRPVIANGYARGFVCGY